MRLSDVLFNSVANNRSNYEIRNKTGVYIMRNTRVVGRCKKKLHKKRVALHFLGV